MDKVNQAMGQTQPSHKNEYKAILDFIAIMQENGRDTSDFTAILNCISGMGKQLQQAAGEVAAMRREISEMQEQNQAEKSVLQKAVASLENKISSARVQLSKIRKNIVEGCTNALNAFKKNGVIALDNVTSFLHIRPGLESMRDIMNSGIRVDTKAIKKIASVSNEYHEIGKHVKNIGRALWDKEPKENTKEMGMFGKTLQIPYKMDKAIATKMVAQIETALSCLESLQEKSEQARTAESNENVDKVVYKKSSVLKSLQELKEKAAKEQPTKPITEKTKEPAI